MLIVARLLIGSCIALSSILLFMSVKHHLDIGTFSYIAQAIVNLL